VTSAATCCAITFGTSMPLADGLSDDMFWLVFWTALLATAAIGALLGVLIGRLINGRVARRLRLAQVWVMMPLSLLAILFSLVAIVGVGGLTLWPSFFLLGFVVGMAPWTEVYSHQ